MLARDGALDMMYGVEHAVTFKINISSSLEIGVLGLTKRRVKNENKNC